MNNRIPILGSGSDFAPFVTKLGVTCADLRYVYDRSLGMSSYPLYHTVYETFHLMETFIDPDFKVAQQSSFDFKFQLKVYYDHHIWSSANNHVQSFLTLSLLGFHAVPQSCESILGRISQTVGRQPYPAFQCRRLLDCYRWLPKLCGTGIWTTDERKWPQSKSW